MPSTVAAVLLWSAGCSFSEGIRRFAKTHLHQNAAKPIWTMGAKASPLFALLPLVCIFLSALLSGCGHGRSDLWKRQEEVLKEQDRLYEAYLVADVSHARQILDQKLRLLEDDTSLLRSGWAHAQFMDYARLYALERRVGNAESAEADLIKSA
jgi:hypothetical protein